MGDVLQEKRLALEARLLALGPLLVAYSGGVDSAYLAFVSHRVLGDSVLAVLADSPSLARSQYADAVAFAQENRIPLRIVHTSEMRNPEYVRNDASRCFHCKDELFNVMDDIRAREGFNAVAYGMNFDDTGDFRPGQRAAGNHSVVAPLLEVGLEKLEIRLLARDAGLRLWDKPASACLSSRIEYGRPVTRAALASIESAEELLRELGFRVFRVRHHGDIARIEVAREEMGRLFEPRVIERIVADFKGLGFKFVTVDLAGYRSGSMNSLLPLAQLVATEES